MRDHAYLDEGLRRWIYRTARQNHWRVASWYELDDLIQDGFMCYQKCAVKYARLLRKRKPQKSDRRNFMALVKVSYERHIHDLANKRRKQKEVAISSLLPKDKEYSLDVVFERLGGTTEQTDFLLRLNELPPKVRNVLVEALQDVLKGKQPKVKELNKRLNAALGSKNSVDMVSRIYKHFGVVRANHA